MAVREIVRNARKNDGIPKTAQQSIPFDRMFPDGICRVGLDYYTKTVQFQDINYQLAQQEDKEHQGKGMERYSGMDHGRQCRKHRF